MTKKFKHICLLLCNVKVIEMNTGFVYAVLNVLFPLLPTDQQLNKVQKLLVFIVNIIATGTLILMI